MAEKDLYYLAACTPPALTGYPAACSGWTNTGSLWYGLYIKESSGVVQMPSYPVLWTLFMLRVIRFFFWCGDTFYAARNQIRVFLFRVLHSSTTLLAGSARWRTLRQFQSCFLGQVGFRQRTCLGSCRIITWYKINNPAFVLFDAKLMVCSQSLFAA